MRVEVINEVEVEKKVESGDILVLGSDEEPYLVVRKRDNIFGRYDIMSFDGNNYWTGDLTKDQLQHYGKKAKAHYKPETYKLKLVEK